MRRVQMTEFVDSMGEHVQCEPFKMIMEHLHVEQPGPGIVYRQMAEQQQVVQHLPQVSVQEHSQSSEDVYMRTFVVRDLMEHTMQTTLW